MPLWQAKELKLEVKKCTYIIVRGAEGRPLAIEGVAGLSAHNPEAVFWKRLKIIVTKTGNWTLISPKDQKRLLLLANNYLHFLGEGRLRQIHATQPPSQRKESDSSISTQTKSQRRKLRKSPVLHAW